MKKLLSITVMLLTITSAIFAATQRETYYVVQQTNFLKDKGYNVYNTEEYKELQEQMKLEKRYFRQALKKAQDVWDEEQEKIVVDGERKEPFPSSSISPRSVMLKGKYTDKEKADEKLSQLESAEYEKLYGKDKGSKSFSTYKKPKKSEEEQLKDEQKRLLGVEAGKKFQKYYSDFLKEKAGVEAPIYVEHVELEKKH